MLKVQNYIFNTKIVFLIVVDTWCEKSDVSIIVHNVKVEINNITSSVYKFVKIKKARI